MLCWVACSGGSGPGASPAGPLPRCGHTFTTLANGDVHVLFGGAGRGTGTKATYLADAHVARVAADGSVTWQAVATEGAAPAPRARHSGAGQQAPAGVGRPGAQGPLQRLLDPRRLGPALGAGRGGGQPAHATRPPHRCVSGMGLQ